jgi:hypothetical protein
VVVYIGVASLVSSNASCYECVKSDSRVGGAGSFMDPLGIQRVFVATLASFSHLAQSLSNSSKCPER